MNKVIEQSRFGEESPCIQGQAAGETPDGVSRWKSATENILLTAYSTSDGATVR